MLEAAAGISRQVEVGLALAARNSFKPALPGHLDAVLRLIHVVSVQDCNIMILHDAPIEDTYLLAAPSLWVDVGWEGHKGRVRIGVSCALALQAPVWCRRVASDTVNAPALQELHDPGGTWGLS